MPPNETRSYRSTRALLAFAVSGFLTVGCAATPEKDPGPSMVDRALMDSAESIATSRRVLAETQNADLVLGLSAEDQRRLRDQAKNVPPGMDQAISLSWDGPIGPGLEVVAQMVGYEYRELGYPDGAAPMVRVRATDRQAIDVVREMGTSVGGRAKVLLHPQTSGSAGRIELKYPGVDE